MKIKHNKKRNTAFVYEALIKEVTIAVIKNDAERKEKAINVLKKHFSEGSVLRKHLECYRSLYETKNISKNASEKIVQEAKIGNRLLDTQGIFVSQTDLIDDVNKELSPSVFSNFVPNYKTLASIHQIFSGNVTPKETVILESQIISQMSSASDAPTGMPSIDNLALNSFVSKFNDKYNETLNESQRTLLSLYICSFTDNSLELKSFLNEEIARLKSKIIDNYDMPELSNDKEMLDKVKKIVEKLDHYKHEQVSESVLSTVLKTQALVKEFDSDGSDD